MIELDRETLGRILGYIVLLLGLLGVAYGVGAYLAWDWNPGHWEPVGRVFALIAAVIAFLLWSGMVRLAELPKERT